MATSHIASAGGGEQIIDSPARQGSFVIVREGLTITHARYAAGEHVAGRHIHHQHTDAFYMLEGEVTFEIGLEAETVTVSAGGFVAAPPGLAHSFRVADSGPARWLTIHAPDGGFAAFMRGLRDGIQVRVGHRPSPRQRRPAGRPGHHLPPAPSEVTLACASVLSPDHRCVPRRRQALATRRGLHRRLHATR